uniref:amino acid ABC transporter permease n=1 Tax=Treponema sp. TaxID=166 RepID=UPI00298E52D6
MNGTASVIKMLHTMMQGTVVSIEVFFLTLLFAIPFAILICAGRMSRVFVLREFVKLVLIVVRGTPLMLQLICVYFIPGQVFGLTLDRFVAAIIALSLNYACYFAEIYRGGFESIPVGQYEACKVLGYTKTQSFFHIVCPQVIKRIVPPMGNEIMTLVKDTALVQVIGVVELLQISKTTSSRLFSTVPLFIAGLFYLIMNTLVALSFNKLEKKLSYYK